MTIEHDLWSIGTHKAEDHANQGEYDDPLYTTVQIPTLSTMYTIGLRTDKDCKMHESDSEWTVRRREETYL